MSGRLTKSLAMAGTALIMLGLAVPAAQASPGDAENVFWQMLCSVDHFGPNDPIVFPGEPGLSHMHSFYGNTSTNADSTAASLMAASSSCGRNMGTSDHSAYWIPSLYKKNADGSFTLVKDPNQLIFVYYRRPGGSRGPKVHPFPLGLAMVAGNARATSPQSLSVVDFDCGGGQAYPSVPKCPGGNSTGLSADVVFPSCWDGTQLDSPDHMSNMAYANPVTGACPADHPVSLPEVDFSIYYNVPGGAQKYVLSSQLANPSHSRYTMHGDFFAAWDPQVQNALVAACLNAGRTCLDVNREGGNLTAGDNGQITITLADYPATSQTVAPTPTSTKSAHARNAATTQAKPSARAIIPAKPATTRSAPSTQSARATKPSLALPDLGQVGLAGGAIGLSLLAFAVYQLRRRRRVQHDRRHWWD